MATRDLALALSLACGFAAQAASELDAARTDAEKSTNVLEQRPCPDFGDKRYLTGMTSEQQIVQSAERERSYQDTAMQQLQQIGRDKQLDQRQRTNLQTLASWSIAASMANWSLLQVANQALQNPLVARGQPYPSAALEGARERIRRVAESSGLQADAAEAVRRQVHAIDRCLTNFNKSVFQLNQPQFDAEVEKASTLAELSQVEQTYRAREAANAGHGKDSVDRLAARKSALQEEDRIAREKANAVNAADASRRRADQEKQQAEYRAKLSTYLAVAKRFTDASDRGDQRAAVAEMANDIVMSTPTGTYRGIDQVVEAVRRQAASGRAGSLGTPQITQDRIVAYGKSGGMGIRTIFSFDGSGRISRMDISI
ncbi:MAG: hypothetical protein IV093_16965 [Rubrivivax sp.]|nr:hypothetical protein [Rubrivivax sp.]